MNKTTAQYIGTAMLLLFAVVTLSGCIGQEEELAGTIEIDGSSTVFPITQAVAEEF